MTQYDLVMILVIAVFILWELWGALRGRGKIKIRGKIYGNAIAAALLGALMAFAVIFRREALTVEPLLFGMIAVSVVLSFFTQAGISKNGIYFRGKLLKYDGKMLYTFEGDKDQKDFVTFRFVTKREYLISFPKEKKEEVIAHLTKYKVVRDTIAEDNLNKLRNR